MTRYFSFTIKDKKFKGYKKIASLLFGINAVLFVAWGLEAGASKRIILFTAAVILLGYAVYHWKYKPKKEKSYLIIYLLIAGIWFTETTYWYFAFVYLALPLLQYSMEKDFAIVVSDQDIIFAGLTRTNFAWDRFDNIILKDGLLTLDFTNNRIIQAEPDLFNSAGLDIVADKDEDAWKKGEDYSRLEKEFNEFCIENLKS
jgi:hypothetical protein